MDLRKALRLSWIENTICFSALALLALLPFIDLVLRQFNLTISGVNSIIRHLFLVTGFFAAMRTVRSGEHISISFVQFIKNDNIKKILFAICIIISVLLLVILFWDSVCFVMNSLLGKKIGFVSDKVFAAAMPLGFAVIAFRFFLKLNNWRDRIIAIVIILFGCFAALPAIAKIIWGTAPPEPFYSWVNILYDFAIPLKVPIILFLIIAGLAGMPIFLVIGGIAMIMLQAAGHEPEMITDAVFSALTEADLIAIPLFTLTGFFLSESKAGERLVRTFKIFFGWMPGGIIIAAVVICAFFSSFTGASGVTILALGGILFTILNQNNYSERFSIGMLTSSGGIGLMFPPSLPIILVASSTITMLHYMNLPTDYSIKHYFIGALLPGIILVLAMMITGFVLSRKVKFTPIKFSFKDGMDSLKDSAFEVLLPLLLIIGYFSGFLTLVEVSAVSVIYVIIVEIFIKKDIHISSVPKILFKAVPIVGGILAILAMAKALSYTFIDSGVPDSFALWMQNAINSKFVFLLLLNLVLLLLGCVLDIFSAILVLLPLIIPLGIAYGIDPLHLGIIFIINLEAGFLTPPVGINLFLASYRFGKPFMEICGYVVPFLLVRLVVVLLVTYLPWLSLWLVKLFGG
ncbi:MAG: TRAP transporter large permease subunit [Treponema sp.]|jgi:tripartite ATP-independent transporter DctM subunit|nr:TRAP transporter large permease subunit [Treponema sp.]